ncbi:hypothetical protein CPT_Mater82 [Bacillus phage Mater]|uniref:Uncharacterized protein n=1 Tax=Bacillus phage Mater TaxID=1540090 RepID=A0A0A0RNL8_9CAUD|nr:hypothetical protein CPT_Mater82 [Bacillus phage Mater]AIW03239.1 hypothetical protein CPT_Mater82 [Bacillus phage Mater]
MKMVDILALTEGTFKVAKPAAMEGTVGYQKWKNVAIIRTAYSVRFIAPGGLDARYGECVPMCGSALRAEWEPVAIEEVGW